MKKYSLIFTALLMGFVFSLVQAQEEMTGLRGDPAAIADAEAMVEQMGGKEIWAQLKSVHFVHEWFPYYRKDAYIENEILDLTGPRSWVEMKSEIYYRLRAYSRDFKYWSVTNGEFAWGSEERFEAAMSRAPYNFYRLIRAVAIGDPYYEIRFGEGDIPQSRRLEFYGPDGEMYGWIILNARKEPIVKATREYRYTLGPMKRYGNLRIPSWAVYDNGLTMYELISVVGDNKTPDLSLFQPPAEFRE